MNAWVRSTLLVSSRDNSVLDNPPFSVYERADSVPKQVEVECMQGH
jgi:hypothetical protein